MKNFEFWDKIIEEENYQQRLNPAAIHGIEAYNKSGEFDAGRILEKIICHKPESKKLLEYGCGDGRILQHLIKDYMVTGVDSSLNLINICYDKFQDNDFSVCDYKGNFKNPFKFDVIYSVTVFIHMTQADGLQIINNILHHLKSGGLLLLDIPIYETGTDQDGWIGVTTWSIEQFKKMADALDLEILELYTNSGQFSYENVGVNHGKINVLRNGKK